MKLIVSLIAMTLAAVFFFFIYVTRTGGGFHLWHAVAGLLIVGFISFLFTTVAARAIAIVGTNPVSGMTLMTLIISSVILKAVGLTGNEGIVAALIIGGVVCTALSMSGGFVSDLKIGYWLGTTPKVQQEWKFLGTLVAAVSVTLVIMLLDATFGFKEGGLAAPQANAMAAVIEPLMTGQPAPWLLYMAGVFMALVLEWTGVPALAFALGMYLPLTLNTPILAGGLVAYFVGRGKNDKVIAKRKERGTLMASGFVAGGAIMGVIAALIRFGGQQLWGQKAAESAAGAAELADHADLLKSLSSGASDYIGMADSAANSMIAQADSVMAHLHAAAGDSVRIVAEQLVVRAHAIKAITQQAADQAGTTFTQIAGSLADKTALHTAESWTPMKALGLDTWLAKPASAILALVLFGGLCMFLYKGGRSAAED